MRKVLFFAFLAACFVIAGTPAFAQEHAEAMEAAAKVPYGAIAGALALAIAAAFGALGQGKAIVSACEGTARNPGATGDIRTTLLIGLAFIESLVLYVFAVAFLIMGK